MNEELRGPVAVDIDPKLEEFLEVTSIQALIELTRQNAVLADLLCHEPVAQGFTRAEDMAAAFHGELSEMPEADVNKKVEEMRAKYSEVLENNGISDEHLRKVFKKVWVYGRLSHPTVELLEEVLSEMEGAEKTAVFSAGLSAIDAVVKHSTKPAHSSESEEYVTGGKTVVIGSIYGGTYAQFVDTAAQTGRKVEFLTVEEFQEKGLPADTKLVFFEPCNNPTLDVVPVKQIVEAARKIGATTACDSTFTPLTVKPLELGVDAVIHSLTKYAGGRSEDTGGSVSGKTEFIQKFSDLHHGVRMVGGTTMASRVAWAFLQNMQDLPERLYLATQNARKLKAVAEEHGLDVRFIEDEANYQEIRNPALPDTVSNGMLVIDFKSTEKARAFVDKLSENGIGRSAVSLGAKETLYSIPADTTHSEMPLEEQVKAGITPGMVRISCGVEKDLVEKAEQVLQELLET